MHQLFYAEIQKKKYKKYLCCRDDEEDGEWEAPQINNPKCKESGCGEWKAPLIENPNYKGKWTPALIVNPKYKVRLTFKYI